MKKKKKSFLGILVSLVFSLVLIALIGVTVLCGFLFVKFDVNLFSCVDQVNKLNGNVDLTSLVTNGYTSYQSFENKIKSAQNDDSLIQLSFTDRELCAYLNHNLSQIDDFKFGNQSLKINQNNLEVLQIKFSNIDINQPSKHYCNMNVVMKLNISSLKNQIMGSFPLNLMQGLIHDELYISTNYSLDEVDGTYRVTPINITINNLNYSDVKSFFSNLNHLVSFTTADEFNQNLATVFADALLGDNGFYNKIELANKTGYGWQSENNFIVYLADISQKFTISYSDSHGVENSNLTKYTIKNNIIVLQDLVDPGYEFLGWYTLIDGEEVKISTIDASQRQDYSLYSQWQTIEYTITCNLRGGMIAGNTDTYYLKYTIRSDTFNLPTTATKKISDSLTLNFAGWIGEKYNVITKDITINQGSYGNQTYTAYYENESSKLTLVVDGVTVNTTSIDTGTVLSLNDINNLVKNKLSGYTINDWYLENSYTNKYNYSSQFVDDKIIYATATYLTDGVYFYPYLNEFDNAVNHNSTIEINTREKLIAYIDYCIFYDVTKIINLKLTYIISNYSLIIEEIKSASNQRNSLIQFKKAYRAICDSNGIYGMYYITDSDTNNIAQNHYDGNVYPQQDYVFRADNLSARTADYDNFAINQIGKCVTVSTSEQLVWVMENGYQPICESNSGAEKIYQKAKQVLRQICTDEMTDIEKLQAIYKWLALNVSYDQEALTTYEELAQMNQTNADANARTYDSWYAEGVFDYKKAVCEGYAKSLLILAKLEGIPTVRVSGNGHMWNKVYLDGIWYGIDATHADLGLLDSNGNKEIFTYTAFLFTDEYKTKKHYTATNYTDFIANTNFNVYSYTKFTYNGKTYDLFIDNKEELTALFNYIGSYHPEISCSFYTIEVAVSSSNQTNFQLWIMTSGWTIIVTDNDSSGNIVYQLKHNN